MDFTQHFETNYLFEIVFISASICWIFVVVFVLFFKERLHRYLGVFFFNQRITDLLSFQKLTYDCQLCCVLACVRATKYSLSHKKKNSIQFKKNYLASVLFKSWNMY